MALAYLISAYQDPQQLARLVRRLQGDADFFIHVDKRVDIRPFQEALYGEPQVTWTKRRYVVSWGGYSQVQYVLANLAEMLKTGVRYEKVFCLSGADYPAVSGEKLCWMLEVTRGRQWLAAYSITEGHEMTQLAKIRQYWFFDLPFHGRAMRHAARFVLDAAQWLLRMLHLRKRPLLDAAGQPLEVLFGADYWALEYDCATYVYRRMQTDKRLVHFLRSCFAPSELFVHTIVGSSQYRDTMLGGIQCTNPDLHRLDMLHFMIYTGAVQGLDLSHRQQILASHKPFFRKAVTGVSNALMDRLDEHTAADQAGSWCEADCVRALRGEQA